MLAKIKDNPALIVGAITAIVSLLAAFGLAITGAQSGAITAVALAVLTLISAGVTRSQVSPSARVAALVNPATGVVEAGPASDVQTGVPVEITTGAVDPVVVDPPADPAPPAPGAPTT